MLVRRNLQWLVPILIQVCYVFMLDARKFPTEFPTQQKFPML